LRFLHVMCQVFVKQLGTNAPPFDILLYRWNCCSCFPPFENCFTISFTYYIIMMLLRQPPHNFSLVSSTCTWHSTTFQTMHLVTPMVLAMCYWLVLTTLDTIVVINTFLNKEFRPCLAEVKVTYASYMLHKACKAFSDPLLEVMYLGKNALKLSYSTIFYTMFLFLHYEIVLK